MIKPVYLFLTACLSLLVAPALCQKVITTDSGKKIMINPDGTWSDIEDTKETNPNLNNDAKPERTIESHMAYNNKDQDDYQRLRTEILKKYDEVKTKQFKNKNNISVVKEEIKKAKKENKDDLSLRGLEERKLQYYLSEYDIEKEMDLIKPFKLSVDRIDNQGFNTVLYQNLKDNYIKYAGNSYAIDVTESNPDFSQTVVNNEPEPTYDKPVAQLTEKEIRDNDIKRELTYYSFDTDETDVLRNPPENQCKIKLKGIDKRTRKERTELESAFLFGYTHPNIKSYFKEKDYLTCNAKLSKVGGLYYLSLEIRIASIKANKTYGSLDKGSSIRIKLLDGETVHLYNISGATGIIEPLTGVTVYQTNYPMEKGEYKQLSKTELDKIGIIWSTGYEEYEIYEVDFLMNQAECLKNS